MTECGERRREAPANRVLWQRNVADEHIMTPVAAIPGFLRRGLEISHRETGVETVQDGTVLQHGEAAAALGVAGHLAAVERQVRGRRDGESFEVQSGDDVPQNETQAGGDIRQLGAGNERGRYGVVQTTGAEHDGPTA